MSKRTILVGVLLSGLLVLVSYHQHSLTQEEFIEGQSVKCTVCLHGKITLSHTVVITPLEKRHEGVELPSIRPHRSVERFSFPSRAPPES